MEIGKARHVFKERQHEARKQASAAGGRMVEKGSTRAERKRGRRKVGMREMKVRERKKLKSKHMRVECRWSFLLKVWPKQREEKLDSREKVERLDSSERSERWRGSTYSTEMMAVFPSSIVASALAPTSVILL